MRVVPIRSDGCLSYILVDGSEAAVIDPARDTKKYHVAAGEADAEVKFVIDTHTHADHLSGARKLADELGARLVMSARHGDQWRAAEGKADALGIGDILRQNGGVKVEHAVRDGDTVELGSSGLSFLESPGHTTDSLVVLTGQRAFTGDTLLIGQTGRCDLPGGSGSELYDTLFGRLQELGDDTFIYPGHDYDGQTVTALGFERVNNRFLVKRTRDEFEKFLAEAFPSLTGAGMQCGATVAGAGSCEAPVDPLRDEVSGFMDAYFFSGNADHDVLPRELHTELRDGQKLVVLDVREPKEYVEGHVEGAHNLSVHQLDATLDQVPAGKDDAVVTICRSGKRSGWAAMFLRVAGWNNVRNMPGGMLAWQKEGLPAKTGSDR